LLHERVGELRRRGVSWQKIADALGTSRQSAWERFRASEQGPDGLDPGR
jgi:transcriptional regulator